MYYCYNNPNLINNKSNKNKKKYDPYRELTKSLVEKIKSTDINLLISINLYLKSDMLQEVEKVALSIYQNQNINYKKIEKEVKNLHDRYGTSNLLYAYIIGCSQVLDDYLFNRVVSEDRRVQKAENIEEIREICSVISLIAFASLTYAYDLLNYKIEGITISDNCLKLRRSVKRENISIISGLFGVPFFLGAESSIDAYNTMSQDLGHQRAIEEYFRVQSVVFFQNMLELSFFKDEFSKYFKIEYNLNYDELYDKRVFAIGVDVMRLRKVLPPNGGVILKFIDDEYIESIYFNEKEDVDDRIVAGVVRYVDGSENDFSFLLSKVIGCNIYCKHCERVFMALLKFYEVSYPNFENILKKYGNPNFEVISPYYWKYRKQNYETNKERTQRLEGKKVKREYTVKISTFIRKIKGEASAESKALAEKLFIKLEPNHTVVREHTRTYNKSNTSNTLEALKKFIDLLEK